MTSDEDGLELCPQHRCCIRVPRVEAASDHTHLAGEWHLRWMPGDRAWFLVPPRGNVWEVRVAEGADPAAELAVDGVMFEDVRQEIARRSLFPPC